MVDAIVSTASKLKESHQRLPDRSERAAAAIAPG
jgi:hypothetical protein